MDLGKKDKKAKKDKKDKKHGGATNLPPYGGVYAPGGRGMPPPGQFGAYGAPPGYGAPGGQFGAPGQFGQPGAFGQVRKFLPLRQVLFIFCVPNPCLCACMFAWLGTYPCAFPFTSLSVPLLSVQLMLHVIS